MPDDSDEDEDDGHGSLLLALLDAHVRHENNLSDVEASHAERVQQIHRLHQQSVMFREW